jgi:hypothetical protein
MKTCYLVNCPEGLFLFGDGHLGFKTEYKTLNSHGVYQSDAYVVASGEYFWGGASSAEERELLDVTPISYDGAAEALRTVSAQEQAQSTETNVNETGH